MPNNNGRKNLPNSKRVWQKTINKTANISSTSGKLFFLKSFTVTVILIEKNVHHTRKENDLKKKRPKNAKLEANLAFRIEIGIQ